VTTAPASRPRMVVYPAIDLLGGRCVRLRQGDYAQVTVYSDDPVAVAMGFREAGAEWVHVVDLDAARSGVPEHHGLIARIRAETGLRVQTGGGVRNLASLEAHLSAGVERVVLGTSAVKDRPFTTEALRRFGSAIAIGIDARGGEVSVDGWTSGGGVKALEFAGWMEALGARTAIFTDIARDGMLAGPALDATAELVRGTGLAVIASGGIGALADIEAVRAVGAAGVIVGKALYEGKVDLAACLRNA
jgi:phosphoribosylformimino-5-aminoimidazole carboxamide ribotide isomerase